MIVGGSFGAVVTNFKLDDIKKNGPLTVQTALAPLHPREMKRKQ